MQYSPLFLSLFLIVSTLTAAQSEDEPASLAEKTADMTAYTGFFPIYWNETEGKLWLEVDRWGEEFLYVSSLATGLGSNDVGLDRAQLGSTRVVYFERVGPKVLLVQPNYDYRATSDNPNERRAADEAFATSVVWGFKVDAEENGRVLVDATDFFLRDAHDVVGTLKRSDQGSYTADGSRSAIYLPRTKNFPKNTEVEATLTFTGDPQGGYVRQVAPDPQSITLRQHHSFIELPDSRYTPRKFDPRAGLFPLTYVDYGVPIDQPVEQRFIRRHRLEKVDPDADVSDPVEPIVYYLDPGTPEPIRSALLEGASWWNEAFEEIGYRDAFQVRLLPDGADTMDVRYNTITWVHRSTRGWSYGSSVTDPRTGEIIKGHVTLGSLRVRQDFLIASGLKALYDGNGDTTPATELALARLRQLSAHEVGHTLGFAHNFAASVDGRASVMDYPPPRVTLDSNGDISFVEAYDAGIGEWDKITVAYAYASFANETTEKQELDKILRRAADSDLGFISDSDARATGGAHPDAHLWDDGDDVIEALDSALAVRAKALEDFSEANVPIGTPLSNLEEALVPVYLYHRYQTEAAAKILGGVHYAYTVRGDSQPAPAPVDPVRQHAAFDALLRTIDAESLRLPDRILELIPPRAFGHPSHRELFKGRTGPTLDPVAMAETAAELTLGLILHPQRAERLVQQHARDDRQPSLDHVVDRLLDETWKQRKPRENVSAEIQRAIDNLLLQKLLDLAANDGASSLVRETVHGKLVSFRSWLEPIAMIPFQQRTRAHRIYGASQIDRFLADPDERTVTKPLPQPPGSPIGAAWEDFCSWGSSPEH